MNRSMRRSGRFTLGLVAGLVALTVFLVACGEAEAPTPVVVEKEVIKEVVKPVVVHMEGVVGTDGVLLLALGEQNSSGQTGWASLTAKGDQTVVVLSVPPGTLVSELVHIHSGTCGNDTLGPIAHGLNNIVDGVSVTTVSATLASLRTGDFAINSHELGNPGLYTTCGNIPVEADALTIALGEQNSSGQSGWATLTARGSKTEVVLQVSPGALVSELVHIHSDTCGNDTLGPIAYRLTNIAGGVSMTTVDATMASLRTGDLAINAHEKGNPGLYTACGNIPVAEGAGGSTSTTTVAVDIVDFTHQDVTVTVGTTVTWTQQDSAFHTTTSGSMSILSGIWDSPALGKGDSFSFTFDEVGTFQYFCRFHPSIMQATITVVA